jgi:hypothetical protein
VDPNITNEPRPDPPRAEPPGPPIPEGQQPAADQPPRFSDQPPALGSLDQAARLKLIGEAQGHMLLAALLVFTSLGFSFFNIENALFEIKNELVQDERMRIMFGRIQPAELRRLFYEIHGIGIGMGLWFLLTVPIIRVAPVPATLLALVVYIGVLIALYYATPVIVHDVPLLPYYFGAWLKVILFFVLVKSASTVFDKIVN